MKKALLTTTLFLASCGGYTALYQPEQETQVTVGTIQMESAARNVGERRVAQRVNQRLRRMFTGTDQAYRLDVNIDESTSTLAVRRDATVARAQLSLDGDINLYQTDKADPVFSTTVTASAAYNSENTPYSTESGKTFARQQAADALADEIARVVWLALREQKQE
ncbi:MAG: hypothetical protein OXR68_04195 [Alphaproteobacteria bacterium]|nr:hypothetical protein [Alphaproteobacteria bacterium]MDD9919808.1 hypothetical protein [Alphaproteobacteria bacterium]